MISKSTSFGEMTEILEIDGRVAAEFLRFDKSGRNHKHGAYESFFVMSGQGKIYCGEEVHQVAAGDLVTIPPKTSHWMEPEGNEPLEGLLWYHQVPLRLSNQVNH